MLCGCACVKECLWRSERIGSLFLCESPRSQTQVVMLGIILNREPLPLSLILAFLGRDTFAISMFKYVIEKIQPLVP